MIEIIKPGTKRKCACYDCGCLFSYEEEDIEETYNKDDVPLSMQKIKRIIRCPQCETVNVLEAIR